mmetsp:Transcript_31436/g.82125  ORF Transcript_31436/g.82125 Transcript_31436/m.82125 type:complete len:200 (-) Transcript_31436:193-792(-)
MLQMRGGESSLDLCTLRRRVVLHQRMSSGRLGQARTLGWAQGSLCCLQGSWSESRARSRGATRHSRGSTRTHTPVRLPIRTVPRERRRKGYCPAWVRVCAAGLFTCSLSVARAARLLGARPRCRRSRCNGPFHIVGGMGSRGVAIRPEAGFAEECSRASGGGARRQARSRCGGTVGLRVHSAARAASRAHVERCQGSRR